MSQELIDAAQAALNAWQTSCYGQPSHQHAMVAAMTELAKMRERAKVRLDRAEHGMLIVAREAIEQERAHAHKAGYKQGYQQARKDAAIEQPAPAAPVSDERAAFEAEMRREEIWGHRSLMKHANGQYKNWQIDVMWAVWQARAALRPAPAQPMSELPDFDELPDDAIDNACSAGGIYRADLMRAWESLRTDGITAQAGEAP